MITPEQMDKMATLVANVCIVGIMFITICAMGLVASGLVWCSLKIIRSMAE